ncbi:MAG: hypothetical protein GKC03_00075 [Methanomassiliicoccales archaeon]|nr:hypothetical protein [Methanomassiliicoccales archaeon]NYT16104.1 hypothetical protein [Methanomassiliicoccales archaeon]
MDVAISPEVKEVLGQRGIKEAEIAEVITSAEASNDKLVNSAGINVARKKIGESTIYAVYTVSNGAAALQAAYGTRLDMGKIVNTMDESEFKCAKCKETAWNGHCEMFYMGVRRVGPALICKECKDVFIEEYLATNTLAVVEALFEKKRA